MSKKTQKTLYCTLSFLSLILAFAVIFRLATGGGIGQAGLVSGKDHREKQAAMTSPYIAETAAGKPGDGKPALVIITKRKPGPAGR